MDTTAIHSEVDIHAPVAKCFEFLVNPHQIPLVMPELIENIDIPELPLKVGDSFKYKYQLFGTILEGDWIVEAVEANKKYIATTTGGATSRWEYNLTETEKGTHVTLDVTYEPPTSVAQKVQSVVLSKITQNSADTFLANLKTVLELRQD